MNDNSHLDALSLTASQMGGIWFGFLAISAILILLIAFCYKDFPKITTLAISAICVFIPIGGYIMILATFSAHKSYG